MQMSHWVKTSFNINEYAVSDFMRSFKEVRCMNPKDCDVSLFAVLEVVYSRSNRCCFLFCCMSWCLINSFWFQLGGGLSI